MNENKRYGAGRFSPLPYILYTLAFIFAHKEDYARVRSLKEFLNNLKLLCGFNHQRIKH